MQPSEPRSAPLTRFVRRRAGVSWVGALALLLGAVSLGSGEADASVFDVHGMTARGTAMGGAQGAAATDHAAVYYNPAALTVRKKVHFGATLQLVSPQLTIDGAANSSRQPVTPSTNVGLTLGAVFPLAGKLDDRIALGVAVFLPVVQVTRLEAIDPATPQFYLHQSLPDALVLAAGLGFEVTDWLSIGVGAQLLAGFEGALEINLDLEERRVERRQLDGALGGEVAPVLGVRLGPWAGLSFGLTWRDDLGLAFALPIELNIDDVGRLMIDPVGRGLYTPDQLNVGLAYEVPGAPLLVAFDVTWMRWSAAPSPTLDALASLDDGGFRPDASDPALLLDLATVDVALGARDVWAPHVGAELGALPWLALQGGYSHRPSPLPDQRGYTSYVDNDAHVFSLGASFTWDDPLEVHANPVSLDLFAQTTWLEPREARKDPALDLEAVGDWRATGLIWNLGLEFRHDF